MSTTTPPRRRLIETSAGTSSDAFGLPEWGLFSAIAVIWGSSFLWMEVGLDHFAPGTITLARVALGGLVLLAFPRARAPIAREDWSRVAQLGVVWTAIPLTLFPIAQQWVDSALAGMLNGAVPLMSALWATILLRTLPGPIQRAGLLVGFAGVVAISLPELSGASSTATGTALIVLATFLYGLATNIAVPLQQRYGALPVILRVQLVATVLVAPYGLIGLRSSEWDLGAAAAMLPLGTLGTGLAFVAMTTLVGRVGSARGAIGIYVVPPVAIALGVLLRDESVHPAALAGTVLVLGGAWLTSRAERRPVEAVTPS